jgi:predicted nucleic acid-binding protein
MNDYPVRANFFDASALTKIFSSEYGSDELTLYFNKHSPTKFTTPFCLYETLNILKSKWKYRNQLSKKAYLEASLRLTAWYRANTKHVKDLDFSDPFIFSKTKDIADKYDLDLSDAFQILTLKEGEYSFFIEDSVTLFVTADKGLAKAAKEEGIKAWYCMEGEAPR